MLKTMGHLALNKDKLIGKRFKFHAYEGKGLQDIVKPRVGTSIEFMVKSADVYGKSRYDIVEGELEIIGLLTEDYEKGKDWFNSVDVWFGMYSCLNYDAINKEFKDIDECVSFISNSKVGMNLCFSHVDYRLEEVRGRYIGVAMRILNYNRVCCDK